MLTLAERFPLLTERGRAMLEFLREHPHAPRYNHECGDRLDAQALAHVQAFETRLYEPRVWRENTMPAWLDDHVAQCYADVPFYRQRGSAPKHFVEIPTMRRAELARAPWAFVPDAQPLDDLIVYTTSGTTGQPLNILSHPFAASAYLPLMRYALKTRGVVLEGGDRVSIVLVCYQRRTYTYAALSTLLDFAGTAKINLHPNDWNDATDRAKFLDACAPEIFTGDPVAFAELMRVDLQHKPKALLSTAMQLLPAFRAKLSAHFDCPVMDLYSLNEAGPVAFARDDAHDLFPHRIHVEIVDEFDAPCAPGVRGEIALTGGFNPFLPLLRYRTGDYASLVWRAGAPVLLDLEGRAPVIFYTLRGEPLNPLDVTKTLAPFALSQFALHQNADRSLVLRAGDDDVDFAQLRAALQRLFGNTQRIDIAPLNASAKVIQYTSAVTAPFSR